MIHHGFGPLIAAFIANAYSLRWVLIYVLIFFIIAIPLIQFGVNYNQGLKQAGKLQFDNTSPDETGIDLHDPINNETVSNIETAPIMKKTDTRDLL